MSQREKRIVTLCLGYAPRLGNLEVDAELSVFDSSFRDEFGMRGQDQCGQATKGMWGMSRRQQAMKGVEDCDKPGETVKQVLMPGFPNRCTLNP
jgi:hypothetical protein